MRAAAAAATAAAAGCRILHFSEETPRLFSFGIAGYRQVEELVLRANHRLLGEAAANAAEGAKAANAPNAAEPEVAAKTQVPGSSAGLRQLLQLAGPSRRYS